MIKMIRKNQVLSAMILASLIIIAAAVIWNCGYLLKPEYRIAQSVARLLENTDGAKASFDITASLDEKAGAETDPLIRLIAGTIKLDGDIAYNFAQGMISVDAAASMAEEEILPLDFYLTIDRDFVSKVEKTDYKGLLKKLPEIKTRTESKMLMVKNKEIPVYVDCYSFEMPAKDFVNLFGIDDDMIRSVPEKLLENSMLQIEIQVDRDCYCRGIIVTVVYKDVEIACDLAINEISTAGKMETISARGRKDLMKMSRDDWLELLTDYML